MSMGYDDDDPRKQDFHDKLRLGFWQKPEKPKDIDKSVVLLCKSCAADIRYPLPFDMTLIRACPDCGEVLFNPPSKEEVDMRVAALQDGRVLNWSKMSEKAPPDDKPFYMAVPHAVAEGWLVMRIPAGQSVQRNDSWWAPDLMGLPFRA